jgi:hypothetical protein
MSDDGGSGADSTKAFLGVDSLSAQVFAFGPIVSYSGASVFGQTVRFSVKYFTEFSAKRRFESDTSWLNLSAAFQAKMR